MGIYLHGMAEMFFECDWVGAELFRSVKAYERITDKLDEESKIIEHDNMSLRTRYIRHIWGDTGEEAREIDLSKAVAIFLEEDAELVGPFKTELEYLTRDSAINWPYGRYFDLDETFEINRLVYWTS